MKEHMKTNVVIVDDNADNLYLLKSLMEKQGWEVREAANGSAALQMIQDPIPDLIVSDILMPVMDGYTLCQHCKADEKLKTSLLSFIQQPTRTEGRKICPGTWCGPVHYQAGGTINPDSNPDQSAGRKEKEFCSGEAPREEMEFFRHYNEILFTSLKRKYSTWKWRTGNSGSWKRSIA